MVSHSVCGHKATFDFETEASVSRITHSLDQIINISNTNSYSISLLQVLDFILNFLMQALHFFSDKELKLF